MSIAPSRTLSPNVLDAAAAAPNGEPIVTAVVREVRLHGRVPDTTPVASAIADQVALVVAGIGTIGEACDALRNAGFCASIAGNRISVGEDLSVQYLGVSRDHGQPAWVILAPSGELPILVCAANRQQ